MSDPVNLTEADWRARLTPAKFKVLRKHGTERAFSGELWDAKTPGTYRCAGCGAELFRSETKYESGTGWPSFHSPIGDAAVETREDRTLWMRRTEVHCMRCKGHLGHVFPDGPDPSGLRYCMNSVAMTLEPDEG